MLYKSLSLNLANKHRRLAGMEHLEPDPLKLQADSQGGKDSGRLQPAFQSLKVVWMSL